jgi:hypothetical protein
MKKLLFTLVLISLVTLSNSQTIVVDGQKSDWATVPILSEPGVFPYAKVSVSNDSVYYMMEVKDIAANHFDYTLTDFMQAYIDADRNSTTGHKSGWLYTSAGIDYLTNNVINYFNNTADNSGWNFVWNWVPIDVSGNATIGEAGILKTNLTSISNQPVTSQIPLATNFGIGFTYKVTGGAENYLPTNDYNFANRNIYSVKPRTSVAVGTGTTSNLLSGNAYYHPFMNDVNINSYVDFQSAAWPTQNPLHWAAWAIDLNAASLCDLKFTRKCDDGGKVQFSLVDMATNLVVKTFPEIWYTVNADTFAEESLGQLDFTDVPLGKYMLKMNNNTTWSSNLKVEKITLTTSVTDFESVKILSNIKIWNKSNSIAVESDKVCDIAVFNSVGVQIAEQKNITSAYITLPKGLYLVVATSNGQHKSEKILIF